MSKKTELILLALILILAAFLRLYRIADYMTFLGDEGRDVLVVKRIVVDHKLTLLGPTASVGGFFLGPLYYYLMIPFLWAWGLNPVGPAVMVALFGIATVFLVYQVGKEFFNYKVGLIAASLYAISPLTIAYSRSSWNPNLMPFFCLLIIWLTWKIVSDDKQHWLFWLGILFGLAIQLHYLTTFLMIVVAVYLLCFYRRLKSYLYALFGFLIGWSPFIFFELRHQFPNLRTLSRFILQGEETGFVVGRFFPIISDIALRLFSRLVTNNQQWLAWVLLLGSLLTFIYLWRKSKPNIKLHQKFSLLGLWWFLGIFLFGFYQKGIYDYYFGFMFALPFLLTGFLLTQLAKVKKIGQLLSLFLGGYLFWVNLQGVPFRFTPNRQLAQTQSVARFIFEKTNGQPFNFALITGNNSDHAYRYFFDVWGNPPLVIENPQIDPERKTVTDQLFVVCEISPCAPLGHPLWEIAGFGRAEIVNRWPVSVLEVYQLKHWQED
jgi:4-amino-4-deoxy-L-arabinose transferase-like glycosyltransferase